MREAFDHDAPRMHILRATSRRSNTRDHIVNRLRELIGDRPDVEIQDENQITYFSCCGHYKFMVKKADEDGNVQLARTQLSFDFCDQAQAVLDDELFPEITNLFLGYVDTNDPKEPTVLLICPREGGHHWMYEILPPAAEVPEEITPAPEAERDANPLVHVKPQEKANEDE